MRGAIEAINPGLSFFANTENETLPPVAIVSNRENLGRLELKWFMFWSSVQFHIKLIKAVVYHTCFFFIYLNAYVCFSAP